MDFIKKNEKIENKTLDSDISELRNTIDEIDEKILDLLNRRLMLAMEIGKIKKKNEAPVIDNARENRIIKRLLCINKGPINENALNQIFKVIIAVSRDVQTL